MINILLILILIKNEEYFNRKHMPERFKNIDEIKKNIAEKRAFEQREIIPENFALRKLTSKLVKTIYGGIENEEAANKFIDVVSDLIYCLYFKIVYRFTKLRYIEANSTFTPKEESVKKIAIEEFGEKYYPAYCEVINDSCFYIISADEKECKNEVLIKDEKDYNKLLKEEY